MLSFLIRGTREKVLIADKNIYMTEKNTINKQMWANWNISISGELEVRNEQKPSKLIKIMKCDPSLSSRKKHIHHFLILQCNI